jgi:hypothetical protein
VGPQGMLIEQEDIETMVIWVIYQPLTIKNEGSKNHFD